LRELNNCECYVCTLEEEEKRWRLERSESARNRSSWSLVSRVPTQKTRRVVEWLWCAISESDRNGGRNHTFLCLINLTRNIIVFPSHVPLTGPSTKHDTLSSQNHYSGHHFTLAFCLTQLHFFFNSSLSVSSTRIIMVETWYKGGLSI